MVYRNPVLDFGYIFYFLGWRLRGHVSAAMTLREPYLGGCSHRDLLKQIRMPAQSVQPYRVAPDLCPPLPHPHPRTEGTQAGRDLV